MGFWMGPLVTEEVQERLWRVTKCRVLMSKLVKIIGFIWYTPLEDEQLEPEKGWFGSDDFLSTNWAIFRFQPLIFPGCISYSKQFNYLELSEVYHFIGGKLDFPLVGLRKLCAWNRGTRGQVFSRIFPWESVIDFVGEVTQWMMMCFPIENGGPVQETICNDARATVYHCLIAMASA